MNIATIVRELQIRKARTDFFTYCKLVYPQFEFGWFHAVLCEEFQRFYAEIKAGKQPRLLLCAPPRHGKSTTMHAFSSWIFGQDPDFMQLGTSYGATLADKNNKYVQRIMDSDIHKEIFPDAVIPNQGSGGRTSSEFKIVNARGEYRSAGVGGPITGTGGDIGIIDDPVKGMKAAASIAVQTEHRNWYAGDFYSRFSPKSGILLFLTRWNVQDLAGWLLDEEKKGGDHWRVLTFPAIAEHDEYQYRFPDHNEYGSTYRDDCECVLLRRAGEALHPERWSLARLAIIQKVTVALGIWDALYQQHPTVKGGDIFKAKWFPRYDKFSDLYVPGANDNAIYATAIHGDTALKTGTQHDYSVFSVWGIGKYDIYLLYVHRGKWEAPELRKEARAVWSMWRGQAHKRPPCRGMYIEDKASGTGLIQDLRRGTQNIPITAVQRNKDKLIRAFDAAPHVQAGHVWLPQSAPWLDDFINEVIAFNKSFTHAHDDQVDTFIDAVNTWIGKGKTIWDLIDE